MLKTGSTKIQHQYNMPYVKGSSQWCQHSDLHFFSNCIKTESLIVA